jgi:tRNA1(Val) A37 N6-methylase TrmN6
VLWPAEGEDLCSLSGHWRILQLVKGNRYSLDDSLVAYRATVVGRSNGTRRALDIGCGIGSVLMMVAWQLRDAEVTGVEAQEVSVGLARRSLAYNGIEDRVRVHHGDLRDEQLLAGLGEFDLVTGTPPYLPLGTGVVSSKDQCGPCRFEYRGGIEHYCRAAALTMAPGGRFVVCHAAPAADRVEKAATSADLTILSKQDVIPRRGRQPLVSVYVMAHGGEVAPGTGGTPLELAEPLVVRDSEGRRTPDYLEVRDFLGMPP